MIRKFIDYTYRQARRIVIAVTGITICIFGVLLIFTPGPAILVIPVGLGILSLEFAWARAWLKKLRETISRRQIKNVPGKPQQPEVEKLRQ